MAEETVRRAFSGAPWEQKVGYCRAIRSGNHVYVSGTAGIRPPVDGGSGIWNGMKKNQRSVARPAELAGIENMASPGIGERARSDQVDRSLPALQQIEVDAQPLQRFT